MFIQRYFVCTLFNFISYESVFAIHLSWEGYPTLLAAVQILLISTRTHCRLASIGPGAKFIHYDGVPTSEPIARTKRAQLNVLSDEAGVQRLKDFWCGTASSR
jgi:hypothetical protein